MSSTASTTAADEDVFASATVDNNMSTKHTNETSHIENSVGGNKETRSTTAPAHDKVKSNDTHSRNVATITGDSDEPIYVSELGQDDVLMGRGAPIINYIGNVRFRELVGTRKMEYLGTARHQVKDGIAKSIIDEIENRGGRFLRKVDAVNLASIESSESLNHDDEDSDLKMPSTIARTSSATKLYQIAEYDAVLEKVKQALRDKDATKRQGDIKGNYDDRNVATAQPPNIGQYDALLGRNQSTHSLLYDAVVGNNSRATMFNADGMLGQTPQLNAIGSISESQPWILHQLQQRLARENIGHLAQRHLQNPQGHLPYNSNLRNHQALQYLTSRHRNEPYAQSSMSSVNPFLASSPIVNVTLDDLLRQNQRNDFLPDPYSLGTARNTARLLYDSITSRNAHRDDSDQLAVLSLLAQQQRQRRESALPDFAMAARHMLFENRQLPTAMLPILGQESQSTGDSSHSDEQVNLFNANGLGIASRLNSETVQHRQPPTTMLSILEQQSQNVPSAETMRLNHTEDSEHKSEISVNRSPTNRSNKDMAIKPSSPKTGSESLDGDREQMKPELSNRKKRKQR